MHVCCHTRVECRSLFDTADYWLRHDVVKWTRFVETTSVWWCHGCVAQPLEPLFTPWVLLEGGRNTKSLKWATYLTYLCFTMTIRSIKNETSTTPSCGGPLRAQMFQKVCFYEQKFGTYGEKCDFWLVRAPFALINSPPPLSHNFFCFTLSHWAYLPKIMFLSTKLRLLAIKGPLGPLRAPFKGPLNSSKTEIFKNNNFFCFTLSHWSYLPKIMFLSPKLRLLAL